MTWTLRDPAGAVTATGPTRRAVIATVAPGTRRPSQRAAWRKLVSDGWTATQDHRTPRPFVPADENRRRILDAALAEARAQGFQWIRRCDVAKRAGVSSGLVSLAYDGMLGLKRAVMAEAVRLGDAVIVAQGLADGNAIAKGAPQALKERAAELMTA